MGRWHKKQAEVRRRKPSTQDMVVRWRPLAAVLRAQDLRRAVIIETDTSVIDLAVPLELDGVILARFEVLDASHLAAWY